MKLSYSLQEEMTSMNNYCRELIEIKFRIANTPFRQNVNAPVAEDINVAPNLNVDEGNQEQRLVATLTKTPRTLHALWQEYEIGGPGRKPVKDWTAQERGRHKHSIYKRKFLAGIEANDVCERIYAAYGHNQSVTKLLDALKRDSRTGGHPNLHIQQI
mmetsp:Transcript_13348/g.16222  ORF Transcript_13348/g.16222 Transcript_13348/m.16222 type:complete len:158 (+) Transcript_13348:204-677(+)